MQKKIEWQYEKLDEASYRAKGIGGWVLLHTCHTTIMNCKDKKMVQSESMVFIPDRDHEWHILPVLQEVKAQLKSQVIAADFEPKK